MARRIGMPIITGRSGPAIEMRVASGFFQWRVQGGNDWTNLAPVIEFEGPQGPPGNDGPPGQDGQDGATGLPGIQGPPGTDGAQGIQGLTGLQGLAGADGAAGQQGIQGIQGLPGIGGDPWAYRSLALNHPATVTAQAAVTGMSFTGLALTTYEIEVFGAFQAAATTTGISMSLDIPSGTVIGLAFAPSSNTAVLATQTRADGAALAATTGVATANANIPLFGKYLVTLGVTGGTVQLMHGSEVAASAVTLQAGLRMKYRAI